MATAAKVKPANLAKQVPVPAEMKRSKALAQAADLEKNKAGPEPVLKDIQKFILPWRGRFNVNETQAQRGKRKDLAVINGTAMRSMSILSSGMMAGLTSPGRPWFRLTTQDPDLSEFTPVRKWLDDVARAMRGLFARSNLYNVLPSLYTEIGGFGTSALLEVQDPRSTVRFVPFTIGTYAIGQDDRLIVDAFSRKYKRTVRQLVSRFGTKNLSQQALLAWQNRKLEQEFDCLHLIFPNGDHRPDALGPASMPIIEEYWEVGGDRQEPLYRGGYQERALFVPRWDVCGDDLWGTGLGHAILGDTKQLQFLERRKEDVIEKHTAPPLEAGAELRGKRLSLLSGDVTYSSPATTGGTSIRPIITTDPNAYRYVVEDIRDKEFKIKQACYEDLFLMLANDTRSGITAREVEERHQEKMLVLGPVLERLNEELFDPLIDRTYNILERLARPVWNGLLQGDAVLPEPPQEMQGQPIRVEYTSILAQAAKATNTRGIEAFGMFVGQLMATFGPSVGDKVDSDQLVDEYADAQGIPARIVRDDDEVAEIRASRQQQEQMQQMAAMADPMAKAAAAAKDLASTAPVDGNLAAQMGAAGGGVVPGVPA